MKSCYDRIVHAFASLAMRRAGAAESATVSMFETLQKLKHKVRTAFGDSDDFFWRRNMERIRSINGSRTRERCRSGNLGSN